MSPVPRPELAHLSLEDKPTSLENWAQDGRRGGRIHAQPAHIQFSLLSVLNSETFLHKYSSFPNPIYLRFARSASSLSTYKFPGLGNVTGPEGA